MSNDVPLLTADQARWLTIHRSVAAQHDVDAIQDSVVAIATGRAVVVPRMTEAEAREKFEVYFASAYSTSIDDLLAKTLWHERIILLRDLGLIRD